MKKSFKLLFASLAITLGIGAAAVAGVSAHSFAKEAEPVSAATNGRFSIIINDGSWWKNDYAQIWATYSDAGQVRITPDPDLGTVENDGFTWHDIGGSWYAVLTMEVDTSTFTYGNFYFARKNPSDGGDWGNSGWVLSPSKVKDGTCNTIYINDSSSFEQSWGNYWKMTTYSGKTSYASTTGATKAAYFKSASYEFVPDSPEAPIGYEFVGWYTDKSFTNQWTTSSRMTADTTLYAKYEAVSVEFNDGDVLTYNGSNSQYEAIKYFDANGTFHLVKTVGSTTTNQATLDSYVSSSVATSDGTNVTVKSAGTYAVYFKSDNTIWIESATAEQEAYMYAGYFLTNVGCDADGVDLPTGWSTVATRYGTLSGDAKDIFYEATGDEGGDTIEQTVARYDYAVAHHPSLTKFMVDHSGTARAALYVPTRVSVFTQETSTTTIVVVVSALLLSGAAVGGYFLLRRKKEKNI